MMSSEVNILLVDDEPANLISLEALLGDLGGNLVRANSGEEALRKLLMQDFAVILLDLRMPTMDGFEVARLIRSRPRSHSTPIIFITASGADEFSVEQAYELGAVDYLNKPIVPVVLRAKVNVFLELYRKGLELARLERERQKAALSAKDERISLILENTRDYAFIITDVDGRILEWEGGAQAITGWNPEEVIGKPVDFLFTPEDLACGRPEIERNRTKETGRSDDKRWHMHKDGTRFYADGVMVALNDAAGQLQGLAKIFRNATTEHMTMRNLRASEEALQDAKTRLQATLNAGEVGTWVFDLQANRVTADANLARLFGVSEADANGGPVQAYIAAIHPDDQDQTKALIQEAIDCNTPFLADYRVRGNDGQWRHVIARGKVEYDEQGTPVRLPGVVVDVTHEKLIEQQLQASEERYRTLFNTIDEGFCILEVEFEKGGHPVDYVFLETNPAFAKHTGLENAIGKSIRQLVPDIEQRWIEMYGRVAATGESIRFIDQSTVMGRWFDVHANRIGEPDSRKVALLFTDITAQKEAQENLRALAADLSEANRRKTEFLATLAHELRNPLAPIRTGLEIMRFGSAKLDTSVTKVIGMMNRQVSQMSHLIDDLMDIARINSGKIELKKQSVDAKAVIAAAVETSMPHIEKMGHIFTAEVPQEEIPLFVDPIRMAQAVGNILNNAAKYTPNGGRLQLQASRQGKELVVSVTDNGMGIPADALPNIFNMFSQVNRNMGRSQGGLGIGLALVQNLVALHDGSVSVSSLGEGKGSTFVIRLPLAEKRNESKTPVEHLVGDQEPCPKYRILIADDNVDAAEALATVLAMQGHEVRIANNGTDALKEAQAFHPDVALLDIGMPGLTGHEVAKEIRIRSDIADMALIALTGWGGEQDRVRSRNAGFDHHMTKPVDTAALNKILSALSEVKA